VISVRGRSGVLSNPFSHSKGWSGLSGVHSHFSLLRVYACTCEVLISMYFTHKGFTLVPLTGLNRSPTNGTGTPDQTMTGNHSLQCGLQKVVKSSSHRALSLHWQSSLAGSPNTRTAPLASSVNLICTHATSFHSLRASARVAVGHVLRLRVRDPMT
jgi:hypothetical protein